MAGCPWVGIFSNRVRVRCQQAIKVCQLVWTTIRTKLLGVHTTQGVLRYVEHLVQLMFNENTVTIVYMCVASRPRWSLFLCTCHTPIWTTIWCPSPSGAACSCICLWWTHKNTIFLTLSQSSFMWLLYTIASAWARYSCAYITKLSHVSVVLQVCAFSLQE